MIKGKEAKARIDLKITEVAEASGAAPKFKGIVFAEGLTVGKDKWYTRRSVELAAQEGVFNGVPMFINHSTEREDYERPERDLRDMVGKIVSTSIVEADGKAALGFEGVLHGSPRYTAEALRTWLKGMLSAGAYPETSQHSWIEGMQSEVEGYPVFVVEHVAKAESLDFVTRGNAGGVIEAAESVKPDEERKNKKTLEGGSPMTVKEILEAMAKDAELKKALKEALKGEFDAEAKESVALAEAISAKEAAVKAKEDAESKLAAIELEKHKGEIISAAKEKVVSAKLSKPVSERVMESVTSLAITKETKKDDVLADVEKVIAKEKAYLEELNKVQVFGNGDGESESPEVMETDEALKKADEILGSLGAKKETEEK